MKIDEPHVWVAKIYTFKIETVEEGKDNAGEQYLEIDFYDSMIIDVLIKMNIQSRAIFGLSKDFLDNLQIIAKQLHAKFPVDTFTVKSYYVSELPTFAHREDIIVNGKKRKGDVYRDKGGEPRWKDYMTVNCIDDDILGINEDPKKRITEMFKNDEFLLRLSKD